MRGWRAGLIGLTLASCSAAPEVSSVAEDLAETPSAVGDAVGGEAVTGPQIAYSYRYGFRLPADAIATTQDRHLALCDRLGAGRCRVGGMTRAAWNGETATGSLSLFVDARIARRVGSQLSALVNEVGGVAGDASIAAEDLSKQISDVGARLRAKEALAERLIGHLRTRQGSVADLVAAERAVADVQEEIDAARSWLAEARGRVSMSRIELDYSTERLSDRGVGGTLGTSFRQMGSFLLESANLLLIVLAALLPWALVAAGIAYAWRRLRRSRTISGDGGSL